MLLARLRATRGMPSYAQVRTIRDHIASLLQSDPRRAGRLAEDLLRCVQAGETPPHAQPGGGRRGEPRPGPGSRRRVERESGRTQHDILAVAWRARAESLVYGGKLDAARRAYETASSFARGSPGLLGQILVGRIGTLLAMGEFEAARPLTRRAEALLRRHGDQDYLRRLHINLGSGHYHRERYAAAHASFSEALGMMEEAGQRDAVWASLLLNQGIACTQLARVQEAREAFEQVAAYGREHGLERLAAQAVFNQGALEALRGSYRAALRMLGEAEAVFARQGAQELLAAACLEQAQIYLDLGMPGEAGDLARGAAGSFASEGMLLDVQLARLAEARSLLLLGRARDSSRILSDAERFYRARRIAPRRARILLELARTALEQGDDTFARRIAGRALRLAERLGMNDLRCACLCLRSELFLRKGDPGRAEETLRELPSLLSSLSLGERLDYWTAASRSARALGQTRLALRRYREAARCVEARQALIPGLDLRAHSFEREVRVYHEQIALRASLPNAAADPVLHLMETARGRTFQELLERGEPKAYEEIVRMRASLGSLVRRQDAVLMREASRMAAAAAAPGPGGSGGSGVSEADRLRKQILELEHRIRVRVRRLETEESPGASAAGTEQARRLADRLAPREVLLEYFVAGDRILAVVVTREKRFLKVLEASPASVGGSLDPLRLQLDSLAATAARPLGDTGFLRRSAEASLQELHAMLLQPLLRQVPLGGRLTIIPHDLLHEVPFECLHDGTDYIDRLWEIARCPTAGFLLRRRSRSEPPATGPVLAIAGTRQASAPASLIEEEARRILRCWPPSQGVLLINPPVDQALASMREARLIHLSAHGSFRQDNPLFSTLHLGPSVLFLADILETSLTADLTVLSACNSGRVFGGRGDALLGVAHAFLVAGSRRLVASLWRVHDAATAEWMELFHRTLREDGDPVAARQEAARSLRARWPHPFYWGGFCVLAG